MSVRRDIDSDRQSEGFVERWSRRKQDAAGGTTEQTDTTEAQQAAEEREAPPVLTDADMPPLDELDERSDYAGFLSPGVSDELRAQALRKLFSLPGQHIPDGLDDYDEDFSRFADLGKTITHEMRRMLEKHYADKSTPNDVQARHRPEASEPEATPVETDDTEQQDETPQTASADSRPSIDRQG